jgi:hypothetical protein
MQRNNELYLLVLSILLGISVLKITEVMQLGVQLREIVNEVKTSGLSVSGVGVFVFVGAYFVFFALMLLAVVAVVKALSAANTDSTQPFDLGPLIAMCVGSLVVAYLAAFSVAMHRMVTP